MSSRFERVSASTEYEGGSSASAAARFRHEDGEEVERESVAHPGAVGVVAHDGEQVCLVRQPREAVGEPDLLELPAGKLDEEGEAPLETAKRELAEEIGKAAEHWEQLARFYTSPGLHRRGGPRSSSRPGLSRRRRSPRSRRTSGSRSSRGRSPTSTR